MPVYTQVILSPDPLYLQPKSYDARSDRKWFADLVSAGVLGSGDYAVTATTSDMNVSVAAGVAYILGQNIPEQGMYRQYAPTANTLIVGANSSGNPRIDTVILRMMDNAHDSSTYSEGRIEIVPGTPTPGADLGNLSGKANLTILGEGSKSVLVLGYVLVPNGATVLTTAGNIKDARTRASVGSGSAFGGVPIGATMEWNSSTVPGGGFWLTEDGSAISRTVYSSLFAIIGTSFGAGDGSSTFQLPDSRGRVPVGFVPSGGHTDVSTVGNTDGLSVASRRVRHRHIVNDPGHIHGELGIFNNNGSNYNDTGGGRAWGSNGAQPSTASATTGISVGPQTGAEPTDGSAYIVKHKIIRVA